MTREARAIRCPDTVLGWIPWYGEFGDDGVSVLDARQRGAVEAHASECSDCRAELEMIAGAPYEIDVDLPDPDRVFGEITARIDAGEAEGLDTAPIAPHPSTTVISIDRARPLSDDDIRRLTMFVLSGDAETESVESADLEQGEAESHVIRGPWARPGAAAAFAAAAAFIIGLVSGGSVGDVNPFASPEVTYDSAAAVSPDSSPLLIDVVFVDIATASEISEGLRGLGVEIVSGPSSVGRYRLKVSGTVADSDVDADLAAITARLKAGPTPLALFAERVLQ